ncbi:MAG: hypothetical protein KDD53_05075 [Bdellovibrionales bacterium]|nr:hypothetical protein [Bdellovibrionales bacterium]
MGIETTQHSGVLEKDSPKFYNLVRRSLGDSAVQELNTAWQEASKLGALCDSPIRREQGVSFNPRPARVGILLIQEAQVYDFKSLKLAIYACIKPHHLNPIEQEANEINSLLDFKISPNLSINLATICSVFLLDHLRHVHMMDGITPENLFEFTKFSFMPKYGQVLPQRMRCLLNKLIDRHESNRGNFASAI